MLHCESALDLLGPYMDGELAESQAAPLRRHLLECPGCRLGARREKSLKLWFSRAGEADAAVPAPPGFAARVARLAFAGALAPRRDESPVESCAGPAESWSTSGSQAGERRRERSDARSLRFVMTLTAVAAGLLLVLSGVLRQVAVPRGEELQAQEAAELLKQADALNALEERAAAVREDVLAPASRHAPNGSLGRPPVEPAETERR